MAKKMKSFISWSPSRLADYTQCPRMAKYKHLDRLCTTCFQGKLQGGWGHPVVCDACPAEPEVPAAIQRGTEIDKNLTRYVQGTGKTIHKEIRHPKVIKLAKELRAKFKKDEVEVQRQITLDRNFEVCAANDYSRAWLRTALDVLHKTAQKVIDWKTGGIDKRDGSVRSEAKYDDQLAIYQVATFAVFPDLSVVHAALCFVDCGPRHEPMVERKPLLAKDLAKEKARIVKLAYPMMTDTVFAPRPSDRCRWCPYASGKGGPCPY